MKMPFKVLIIGLTGALICSVGFIFWGEESKTNSIVPIEKLTTVAEHIVNKRTSSTDVKARIQTLKDSATERLKEILKITGNTGEQDLSYEDNWCVANEDLLEEEADYAQEQLNEWQLSRGYTIFRGGEEKSFMKGVSTLFDEFIGVNDEHLDAYRYADKDTLLRLADNDDMIALTTMMRSNSGFDGKTKFYSAKKLLILGDTSFGLRHLVAVYLARAQGAKRLKKGREHVKGYLKSALAYIEFGMMRKDVSSLNTYLSMSVDYKKRFSNLYLSEYLTELDYIEIKELARTYYKETNEARLEKGLPSFQDIDKPNKITDIHYAQEMFWNYERYSELLEGNFLPSDWKKNYLPKTPCLERRIAMHNFRMTELPAIRDEVLILEEGFN